MPFDLHEPSTWPSTATPDPEYEAAIKAIGGAPDLGLFSDIATLRKFLEYSNATMVATTDRVPNVVEEDRQISMRDGHQITVRIYRPSTPAPGGSPLGVLYHGGGWCVGGLVNEELLCRLMVSTHNMVVVNVDYRLGPEHQFPTSHHDCYDATKWAASHAASLNADPSHGFLIGGTSAGGNIAATISHLWRDDALTPKLTGCHLMIPLVCAAECHPDDPDLGSWAQLEHAPVLSHAACKLFLDNYIPDLSDREDPLFSPMLWKTGHKGLPPQYFQLCGMDPLRDEALLYERRLREHDGVRTKVSMYEGWPHGFWSMLPQSKGSQKFVRDSVEGVGCYWSRGSSEWVGVTIYRGNGLE